jgi:hypothetical protein
MSTPENAEPQQQQMSPREVLLATLAGWLDSVAREGSTDESITFRKVGYMPGATQGQRAGVVVSARAEVTTAMAPLEYTKIVPATSGIILPKH